MSTAHINAEKGDFAKTVLMPGDPLRAKFIADTYFDNAIEVTNVRGMLGYTGTYKGNRISVMGSGMGMPSIGIYSYELYKFYDVENIIRVGSCGAYVKELDLYDIVMGESAWTQSSYSISQNGEEKEYEYPDEFLLEKLQQKAEELNIPYTNAVIHSNDTFYTEIPKKYLSILEGYGAKVVEIDRKSVV